MKRFPEIRVRLERVADGERAVPEELLPQAGLRTKLGGDLDWIQGDDTPDCTACKRAMSFVAQIDSIGAEAEDNPLADDPEIASSYQFADGGMIYIFLCKRCLKSVSFVQSY